MNRVLEKGDCGLILNVKDTRYPYNLYPLGMLIGKSTRQHKCGLTIYTAIVLRQCLNEIEAKYKHLVQDLRPFGRASNRMADGHDMVPGLVRNPAIASASASACGNMTTPITTRSRTRATDTGLGDSLPDTESYTG